ncbi:MAG: transcriptional regulator [Methanobacteriota archaeon]|nr:MAG: transcriptional regulator [Euryarchaeota archaeon]
MPHLKQNHQIPCAFTRAMQVLSGRWDLVICYKLLDNPLRFNEIKEELTSSFGKTIHAASLTQSLKRLEKEGIITREVNAETMPVTVTYELTEKGKALRNAINELKKWGEHWTEQ